jgi:hypothetical protein
MASAGQFQNLSLGHNCASGHFNPRAITMG